MKKYFQNTILLITISIMIFSGCKTQFKNSGISVVIVSGSSEPSSDAGEFPQKADISISLPYRDPNIITDMDFTGFCYMYGALTTDAQRALYKAYLEAVICSAKQTGTVQGALNEEDAKIIVEAVRCDYPQFFAVGPVYKFCALTDKKGVVTGAYIEINYLYFSLSDLKKASEKFYEKVNEFLQGGAQYTSAYEREVYYYENLAKTVKYDYSEAESAGSNLMAHTSFGALVQGVAVCDGYSHAFSLLCNYSGIKATSVSGYLSLVYHAWNMVEIGGEFLFCDLTNDDDEGIFTESSGTIWRNPDKTDGLTALPDRVSHKYFNLTYGEMSESHDFDVKYFPNTAESTDFTWHKKNNVSYSSYGELEDGLKALLKDSAEGNSYEFEISYAVSERDVSSALNKTGYNHSYVWTKNKANSKYVLYIV